MRVGAGGDRDGDLLFYLSPFVHCIIERKEKNAEVGTDRQSSDKLPGRACREGREGREGLRSRASGSRVVCWRSDAGVAIGGAGWLGWPSVARPAPQLADGAIVVTLNDKGRGATGRRGAGALADRPHVQQPEAIVNA